MEFFLNVLLHSVTKIFAITVKGLEPAISCVRDQDATSKTHVRERKTQFMLQLFTRFPKFDEFNESFAPFRKNSDTAHSPIAKTQFNYIW